MYVLTVQWTVSIYVSEWFNLSSHDIIILLLIQKLFPLSIEHQKCEFKLRTETWDKKLSPIKNYLVVL